MEKLQLINKVFKELLKGSYNAHFPQVDMII